MFILLVSASGALLAAQDQNQEQDPTSSEGDSTQLTEGQAETEALKEIRQPFSEIPRPPDTKDLQDRPDPRQPDPVVDVTAYPEDDGCDWAWDDRPFQERSEDAVRGMTCHTLRWFDGWFGDKIDYPEDQVNGLLTIGADYTEKFGFDPRFRFKVRAPTPNMNQRWDLILGRVDEDAFITDTQGQDQVFYNPGLINRGEESWLLGLGGNRRGKGRQGWDWSVGLRLRTPPVPYVKLQWYYYKNFQEAAELRFRQTFFWRSDDGFGTTSRADFSWAIGPTDVLRWEAVGTFSDVTPGTEWYVGQTWYHLLGDRSAFSLLAFARGETDAPVSLREYGFNFIWRRPFTRDWIYLSYGPSVTWPQLNEDSKREISLGFGMWIEMEFGNWVWR